MEIYKCPSCANVDLLDDLFSWQPDQYGHPTIENMTCKNCLCSNHYIEYVENGQRKQNDIVSLDDFKEVSFSSVTDEEKKRLSKRYRELNQPKEQETQNDNELPF